MTINAATMSEELGLDLQVAQAILRTVEEAGGSTQVTVGEVMARSGAPFKAVKDSLLYMLLRFYLRATFEPRHRQCGMVLGPPKDDAVSFGRFGTCPRCSNNVGEDVEIMILFWTRPS